MLKRNTLRLLVAVAVVASSACGGSTPLTSPTQETPRVLAASVQSLVLGSGTGTASGYGVSLSIWAGTRVTASAQLELSFSDGSAALYVPFDPSSVSIGPNARGLLSTSVPDASDPRLGGRTPSSFRAVITLRDDSGSEQTLFLALSVASR